MTTTPSVHRADVVVARLIELMETRGSSRYDEAVTQCEHALHAAAKRYLVAVDPGYAATLSTASRRSLAVQGGPLLRDDVRAFEARPHAAAAVRLRRWDDAGKRPGRPIPPFASFGRVMSAVITRARP
jgi:predicted HD phosphohydrolase